MSPTAEPFPPDHFAARRERVFERLGDRALVLPATPHFRRSRDTEYPYRPDSELHWVTGAVEPDLVAVLRGHADDERFVLFAAERDDDVELWTGPRLGVEGARERYGADAAYPIAELEARLPDLLEGAATVAFRLGEGRAGEPAVVEALRRARARGARRGSGPRGVVDPGEILDDLRMRKDPLEVSRIRSAAEVTVAAFREITALLRAGTGEWEIQGRLDGAFRALGGDGPAYETIVGSGPNACVLHYVDHRRVLRHGELVLVDAGASVGLYAADLTRTFPVDGRFGGAARSVYEVVEAARVAAVAAVRPGATVADVHGAAVDEITRGLEALGVIDVADDADARHRPWFPHQTSHWLGQDVHDVGDYARGGESRVLEPGMVLTVEPGLYFGRRAVERAPRRAEAFAGIGVRIEDDVLVTDTGHDVLTSAMPTAPGEVADLVAGAR